MIQKSDISGFRAAFFAFLLIVSPAMSQDVEILPKIDTASYSNYIVVAKTDDFAVTFSPKKRVLNAFAFGESRGDQSKINYKNSFNIIKHNIGGNVEVASFSAPKKTSIVGYHADQEHFIAISTFSENNDESFYAEQVRFDGLHSVQKSKEIIRFTNGEKHELLYFEKKTNASYELMLTNAPSSGQPLTYYYFILDANLKVKHYQKIRLDEAYRASKINYIHVGEEKSTILLSNNTIYAESAQGEKFFHGKFDLYPDRYVFSSFPVESDAYIINSCNFGKEKGKAFISLVVDQKKNIPIQLKITDEGNYSKTSIPQAFLNAIGASSLPKGKYNYYFNQLDDFIFSVGVYATQLNLKTNHTETKRGPVLFFKTDANGDIEWSKIIDKNNERQDRIASDLLSVRSDEFVHLLFTNAKKDIVLAKLNKESGEIEQQVLESLSPYNFNYVNLSGSVLFENSAFLYIQNFDPETDHGLITEDYTTVLLKF